MKITFIETETILKKLKDLMEQYDEYYWAVAWATTPTGDHAQALLDNADKIQKIVIGTDFYQTDPKLLRKLKKSGSTIHVMEATGTGTFHPKIYYFESKSKAAAIVGSANFTEAAMSINTEASILIEGNKDLKILSDIKKSVAGYYGEGKPLKEKILKDYEKHRKDYEKYREMKPHTKNLETSFKVAKTTLQEMSWQDYLKRVKAFDQDRLQARLKMLERIKKWLASKHYSELTLDERRAIAGTIDEYDGLDWRAFGSMVGFGKFVSQVNNNNHYFSRALGSLPKTGLVTYAQYDEFIRLFKEGLPSKNPVASVTRLLAMQRPDQFICVNSANTDLLEASGLAPTKKLTLDEYWTEIVKPMRQSNWWNAPAPKKSSDKEIWQNRAAMLDCIYYEN